MGIYARFLICGDCRGFQTVHVDDTRCGGHAGPCPHRHRHGVPRDRRRGFRCADALRDETALLIRLQSEIKAGLDGLDNDLARACYDLGQTGLRNDAARQVLLNLSRTDRGIVDCTTVDASGTIPAAEPAAYRGVEGADVWNQPNVRHVLATKRPVMSEVVTVAEGFEAAIVSAPVFTNGGVFSDEGRFIGFASIVFRPEDFLSTIVAPAVGEAPFSVTVAQTDGRILYDSDSAQIGRMTFDDPLYASYPDLLATARRVVDERDRYGNLRVHRYEQWSSRQKGDLLDDRRAAWYGVAGDRRPRRRIVGGPSLFFRHRERRRTHRLSERRPALLFIQPRSSHPSA